MKKLLALFLVLMLGVSALSVASACGNNNVAYKRAQSIVATANAKIAALVIAAQLTPYDDTSALVFATNVIAANAKQDVARLGLTAACSYTTYRVDGKYVTIDPLYVVNPLPKQKGDEEGDQKN